MGGSRNKNEDLRNLKEEFRVKRGVLEQEEIDLSE